MYLNCLPVFSQGNNLKINNNDLVLKVDLSSAYNQCDEIVAKITLTAKRRTIIYDLQTGKLKFSLIQIDTLLGIRKIYEAQTGGNIRYERTLDCEGCLMEDIAIPIEQKTIVLNKGESISTQKRLNSFIIKNGLPAFNYVLHVKYEEIITDSVNFHVTKNFKKCIPVFIDSLKSHDRFTVDYSRVILYSFQNEHAPQTPDIENEYITFSKWWTLNKILVSQIQDILESTDSKDRFSYRKEIPILISKMKTGDSNQKIKCIMKICKLTNYCIKDDIVNSETNSFNNELQKFINWWESNKFLIDLINKGYWPDLVHS